VYAFSDLKYCNVIVGIHKIMHMTASTLFQVCIDVRASVAVYHIIALVDGCVEEISKECFTSFHCCTEWPDFTPEQFHCEGPLPLMGGGAA